MGCEASRKRSISYFYLRSKIVVVEVNVVVKLITKCGWCNLVKCVYFLLSRAPLGPSHYLTPVVLGQFLIMRKILLMCPSSQCWSEHPAFYSICGTVLPFANGVNAKQWDVIPMLPPTILTPHALESRLHVAMTARAEEGASWGRGREKSFMVHGSCVRKLRDNW